MIITKTNKFYQSNPYTLESAESNCYVELKKAQKKVLDIDAVLKKSAINAVAFKKTVETLQQDGLLVIEMQKAA